MSLIWHIAWKDLRRLRGLIVLWAALIAAKPGIGVLLLQGWGDRWFDGLRGANFGLSGLEIIAAYFLVAAFVHQDVTVGTTAFWITRPVTGRKLFVAKLVGLAVVFGAIPLLLTIPWWISCSYGIQEILTASVETLAVPGCVALIALPLATLTDGISRFLLTTLVLVTGIIFLMGANSVLLPNGPVTLLMGAIVFIGAGVVAAAHQYWSRRFLRSAATLGIGLAMAVLVSITWVPKPTSAGEVPDNPGRHAAAIDLTLREARAWEIGDPNSTIHLALRVAGTVPEFILRGSAIHSWSWPNGFTLQRSGTLRDFDVGANWLALGLKSPLDPENLKRDQELKARNNELRIQRGLPPFSVSNVAVDIARAEVSVPAALAPRVRRDPPEYRLRTHLQVMRPVVLGESLARKGERIVVGAEVARIAKTEIAYRLRDAKSRDWTSSLPADKSTVVGHRFRTMLVEHAPAFRAKATEVHGLGPFLFSPLAGAGLRFGQSGTGNGLGQRLLLQREPHSDRPNRHSGDCLAHARVRRSCFNGSERSSPDREPARRRYARQTQTPGRRTIHQGTARRALRTYAQYSWRYAMNLVWHIVLKDARRLWPAVLLWALLFNAHFFAEWKLAHAAMDDGENLARLKFVGILLFVVQLLTSYVFAAALVLEDSPIGTSTFWLTRPISGTRLLAAKIASCLLWFGVLAVLLAVPWWLSGEGETSKEISVRAGEFLLWQACTVGTAVVIAAFTGGLGRFLVWSLGAAFAAFAVLLIDRPGILAIDALRWFAVSALAALWLHYQLRRTRLALITLGFGAISSATMALAFIG